MCWFFHLDGMLMPAFPPRLDSVSPNPIGQGEHLLYKVGSLDVGPPDGSLFPGSVLSCEEHGLDHERLTATDLALRFPAYGDLPSDYMAWWVPGVSVGGGGRGGGGCSPLSVVAFPRPNTLFPKTTSYQPEGGFLVPELCISAHVNAAYARGADIHAYETVLDWDRLDGVGTRLTNRARGGKGGGERLV